MTGTILRNLEMFQKLCGKKALRNVILVTTMWHEVDEPTGSRNERLLKTNHWKTMIAAGSRTTRFDSTPECAWAIIKQFTSSPVVVDLQKEIVDLRVILEKTTAGSTFFHFQRKLIGHLQEMIRKTKALKNSQDEGADKKKLVTRKLEHLEEQEKTLRNQLLQSNHPSPRLALSLGSSLPTLRVGLLQISRPSNAGHRAFSTYSEPQMPRISSLAPSSRAYRTQSSSSSREPPFPPFRGYSSHATKPPSFYTPSAPPSLIPTPIIARTLGAQVWGSLEGKGGMSDQSTTDMPPTLGAGHEPLQHSLNETLVNGLSSIPPSSVVPLSTMGSSTTASNPLSESLFLQQTVAHGVNDKLEEQEQRKRRETEEQPRTQEIPRIAIDNLVGRMYAYYITLRLI
jgi:hypothetical protein